MLDQDVNYFNNSIMLLDEIHVDLDSLDFMKRTTAYASIFLTVTKTQYLTLGTTQYLMNVDVRLRRQDIFEVTTHEIDGYYSVPVTTYLLDLSEYYNYYDTNEVIY